MSGDIDNGMAWSDAIGWYWPDTEIRIFQPYFQVVEPKQMSNKYVLREQDSIEAFYYTGLNRDGLISFFGDRFMKLTLYMTILGRSSIGALIHLLLGELSWSSAKTSISSKIVIRSA